MPGLTFQISGVSDVINKLKKFGASVKQDAKDELNATALEIVADAQANAPVDLGNLKNNIGAGPTKDGLEQTVYSRADYSIYVEFGTGTNVDINPPISTGSLEGFYEAYEEMRAYAAQFKGRGLEGKHPVNIKGEWRMVPYQLNLVAHPFFFPAVYKNTAEMVERLKKILKEAADSV